MKQAASLIVFVVLAFLLFELTERDDTPALDLYQFKQEQKRIEKLEAEYLKLDQDLDTLQKKLFLKYDEIDSASTDQLRGLFLEFRERTK